MIESTDLSRIDFIITYHEEPDDVEPPIQREIFLHNLRINGLKLQLKRETNSKDEVVIFVLIECPIEMFFNIAEQIKLQVPIAENDLYEDLPFSSLSKLQCCVMPSYIRWKRRKNFFTIPYTSSLHEK